MAERPLSVAVGIVADDDDILLLKRDKDLYRGLWALPGGKVEYGEHIPDAVEREIQEEAGIDTVFRRHLGIVSEHLVGEDGVTDHFLLHVCELEPADRALTAGDEGAVAWKPVDSIRQAPGQVVPSDRRIIEEYHAASGPQYVDSVMQVTDDGPRLQEFKRR